MQQIGQHFEKKNTSVILFGIFICLCCLALAGLGVWLIAMGSGGSAKFTLLGQEFSSNNIGLSAIFIGAVSLIFCIRRLLKTLDLSSNKYETLVGKLVDNHYDESRDGARKDDFEANA